MPDPPEPPAPEDPPPYTRHRARARPLGPAPEAAGRAPGEPGPAPPPPAGSSAAPQAADAHREAPPPAASPGEAGHLAPPAAPAAPAPDDDARPYTLHRASRGRPRLPLPGRPHLRRPRARRVVLALAQLLVGWVVLSFVLFLVSALVHRDDLGTHLGSSGFPPVRATTVLVLGSDRREAGSKEPGANTGPARADSILLVRVGGGHSARLSIPRDTVVDIPGHGTDKVNAAFALGGAALMARTVRANLGIEVDHVIEVSFSNFPDLIDAMGGVDYTGGCVVSQINGGARNGGTTLRLHRGTTRITGHQALALARTRENSCNPRESDLTRARRQQKLVAAMKARLLSPGAFVRLPFISWAAPKALRSDMGGPTLLGLFAGLATSGTPTTRILRPTGATTLPDGGAGLVVSPARRRSSARRFLAG